MLQKLLHSNWLKPGKVIGLNCEILPNNTFIWKYCILTKKKSSIVIEKTGITEDLGILKKDKAALIPVYLTIEGKGIINREIETDNTESPLYQVIPNAKPEQFYCTETRYTNAAFASVIRKEIAESVYNQIQEAGLSVIYTEIGTFNVFRLFEWFNDLPEKIQSNSIEYHKFKNLQQNCFYNRVETDNDKAYIIAGENLSSAFLTVFASAFYHFTTNVEGFGVYPLHIAQNFWYKRLFVKMGWTILITLFTVLLINYFIYTSYTDKVQVFEKQIRDQNQYLYILNGLKSELKQKENFAHKSGYSGNSKYAYFIDRMVLTVPADIHLSGIKINPPVSKVKKEKQIEYVKNKLIVDGQSISSVVLNDWISVLEKYQWIQKISVENYISNLNTTWGEFEIVIEIVNQSEHEKL